MPAHMAVVVVPGPHHRSSMIKRNEQRLVGALVRQAAVGGFNLAGLLRLARRDVVPLNQLLVR